MAITVLIHIDVDILFCFYLPLFCYTLLSLLLLSLRVLPFSHLVGGPCFHAAAIGFEKPCRTVSIFHTPSDPKSVLFETSLLKDDIICFGLAMANRVLVR